MTSLLPRARSITLAFIGLFGVVVVGLGCNDSETGTVDERLRALANSSDPTRSYIGHWMYPITDEINCVRSFYHEGDVLMQETKCLDDDERGIVRLYPMMIGDEDRIYDDLKDSEYYVIKENGYLSWQDEFDPSPMALEPVDSAMITAERINYGPDIRPLYPLKVKTVKGLRSILKSIEGITKRLDREKRNLKLLDKPGSFAAFQKRKDAVDKRFDRLDPPKTQFTLTYVEMFGRLLTLRMDLPNNLRSYDSYRERMAFQVEACKRELSRYRPLLDMDAFDSTTRVWTNITGKKRIKATLVAYGNEKLYLKKSNGKITSVPVERLSHDDRKVLQERLKMGPLPKQPAK